jgi:hypothetical protein
VRVVRSRSRCRRSRRSTRFNVRRTAAQAPTSRLQLLEASLTTIAQEAFTGGADTRIEENAASHKFDPQPAYRLVEPVCGMNAGARRALERLRPIGPFDPPFTMRRP